MHSTYVPPELWRLVLQHISAPSPFQGMPDPFEYQSIIPVSSFQSGISTSIRTNKSVSLVCKTWHDFGRELLYKHIYVRWTHQLHKLVPLLEKSAEERGDSAPLGWWTTHVKLFIMDYDYEYHVNSDNGKVDSYVRRLLRCCPRLRVFIDAAPYGAKERPPRVLSGLLPLASDHIHLRQLEWTHGGPGIEDLYMLLRASPSLESLKCNTIHPRIISASSSGLPGDISLPNLRALDISLDRNAPLEWLGLIQDWSLPSLTHLTIRGTSQTHNITNDLDASRALRGILRAHGGKLRSLDLDMVPSGIEDRVPGVHNAEDADGNSSMSLFDVLRLCPLLHDLVLSTGCPNSSSIHSYHFDRRRPSPFYISPSSTHHPHANLTRIGFRDSHPGDRRAYSTSPFCACDEEHCKALRQTEHVTPVSTRRHRTVEGHFSDILIGRGSTPFCPFPPQSDTGDDQGDRGKATFPRLKAIRLLDSDAKMLAMHTQNINDLSGGDGLGLVSEEARYWAARAKSCTDAGVVLEDWEGKDVSLAYTERQLASVPTADSNDAICQSPLPPGGTTKKLVAELAVSVRPDNTAVSTISHYIATGVLTYMQLVLMIYKTGRR